jgi:hypothetical protein
MSRPEQDDVRMLVCNHKYGTLHLVNMCCCSMRFPLGMENNECREIRQKEDPEKSPRVSESVHLCKRRQQVTCADRQSSHISMHAKRSLCLSYKNGEIAAASSAEARRRLESPDLDQTEINRGKELQQLRTIRFIIVPPTHISQLATTPTHRHPRQEWAVCRPYPSIFLTVIDPLYH